MKSLLVCAVMALVALVGGSPALAQDAAAYPPRVLIVTVSDGSPEPGAPFDVTLTGCVGREVIEFAFGGESTSVQCAYPTAITGSSGESGSATQRFFAPSDGGSFSGTVALASTDATIGTFGIEIESIVPAAMTLEGSLADESSWTPDLFTLLLLIAAAVAVTVVIRLRLLTE